MFAIPSILTIALACAAVVGPIFTYGAMRAREAIVVSGARQAERNIQVSICNEQRLEIGREISRASTLGVSEVREALGEVTPTPEVPAEILALCKASASCRSRELKP